MRISDWSSDVCSSDLLHVLPVDRQPAAPAIDQRLQPQIAEPPPGQIPAVIADHRSDRARQQQRPEGHLAMRHRDSAKAHDDLGRNRRKDVFERHRSEEHTSELQSLMRISYAVFCLKKKTNKTPQYTAEIHKRDDK